LPASELDHEAIARDLVRALRGTRSQVQLSRRLGYGTNVAYSWESGRRAPTASGFFHLLERTGTDPAAAMAAFYRQPPAWLGDDTGSPAWVQQLLDDLRGHTTLADLSERTGISRHALSRWCRGAAQPRLPELLRFVDGASGRLLAFLDLFVDPAALPSVREAWQRDQRAKQLAWASPWAQVVLLALDLPGYRALPAHSDAWLAGRLGLDELLVADCVARLAATAQVVPDGAHLRSAEVLSLNLRGPDTGVSLKRHWASVASARANVEGAMLSYNVFSISEADLVTLREMQRAHYRAVRALVAASTSAERVVLLNVHTVPLDRPVGESE
jgi:transcriptional regulator with XRE-family HTH domain